jgi:hypothetical protein
LEGDETSMLDILKMENHRLYQVTVKPWSNISKRPLPWLGGPYGHCHVFEFARRLFRMVTHPLARWIRVLHYPPMNGSDEQEF